MSEKMFGNISPPRDLLPSIVLIKSQPSLAVFLLSSLCLSYFFRVAIVVGYTKARHAAISFSKWSSGQSS